MIRPLFSPSVQVLAMSPVANKKKLLGPVEENESHENNLDEKEKEGDAFLDPSWFLSLSEPQLDMLVYLKLLAITKAKNAGCEELVEEFNGKIICSLGSVLFKYFKERMKEASLGSAGCCKPLEDYKLLSPKRGNLSQATGFEDPDPSNAASLKRKRVQND